MGRKSKGVHTINELSCLNYSLLVQQGYLLKGQGTGEERITWCKRGIITEQVVIEAPCSPYLGKQYLSLSFCVAEPDGNLVVHRQTIELVEVDSNLGRGKVTYFLCPVTGHKCRKLYKFENGITWQCRLAFEERLYYPLQLCSQMNSYRDRRWAYINRLENLEQKKIITRHKGKLTKRFVKRSDLRAKNHEMYNMMWSPLSMPLKDRMALEKTIEALKEQRWD